MVPQMSAWSSIRPCLRAPVAVATSSSPSSFARKASRRTRSRRCALRSTASRSRCAYLRYAALKARLLTPLLAMQIISAQQLPRPRGSGSDVDACVLDPFVEVSLFVPGVVGMQKRRTPVVL